MSDGERIKDIRGTFGQLSQKVIDWLKANSMSGFEALPPEAKDWTAEELYNYYFGKNPSDSERSDAK